MDFEQARQTAEGIQNAAKELYRKDARVRVLIDSSVSMARHIEGPVDPEKAERDAHYLAQRACALLAARIFHEDAELAAMREERDRYRKLAVDTLATTPKPMFMPVSGVNEFPNFVKQVRSDQSS